MTIDGNNAPTRKALARLIGYYALTVFAVGGMYGAAVRLAVVARESALDTRPCPDCREGRAAVVDAEPPAAAAAGDPSPWVKVRDNPQA